MKPVARRNPLRARIESERTAQTAQETVDQLQTQLREWDAKAADAVVASQTDERKGAKARLEKLRQEKVEIGQRLAAERAALAKAERAKDVTIRKSA